MNIANYSIISTTEQTPENQRTRLTQYVWEKGWDFKVYTEIEAPEKPDQ